METPLEMTQDGSPFLEPYPGPTAVGSTALFPLSHQGSSRHKLCTVTKALQRQGLFQMILRSPPHLAGKKGRETPLCFPHSDYSLSNLSRLIPPHPIVCPPCGCWAQNFLNKNWFHNLLACTAQMVSTLGYFAKAAKVKYNIPLHKKLQIQSAKGTYSKGI